MLSLEPNEHLGHILGTVNFSFYQSVEKGKCTFAVAKRFCGTMKQLTKVLNFSFAISFDYNTMME